MTSRVPRRPWLFIGSTALFAVCTALWVLALLWQLAFLLQGQGRPTTLLFTVALSTVLFVPPAIAGWYIRQWTRAERPRGAAGADEAPADVATRM
jgi:hypothetical protein